MFGSGQRIGTERIITVKARRTILQALTVGSIECFAAAPGALYRRTFAQLDGSGGCQRGGTSTSVSVWPFPPGSYILSSEFLFSAVAPGTGAMPLFAANFLSGDVASTVSGAHHFFKIPIQFLSLNPQVRYGSRQFP